MHDEFYSLTGKLKNISKGLYGFSLVGATRRLPFFFFNSIFIQEHPI